MLMWPDCEFAMDSQATTDVKKVCAASGNIPVFGNSAHAFRVGGNRLEGVERFAGKGISLCPPNEEQVKAKLVPVVTS